VKEFFQSNLWQTIMLFFLGIVSAFTGEIVTFIMLGFVIIMLSNIYDKLDDIFKKNNPL